MKRVLLVMFLTALTIVSFSGCSAMQTAITKRNLDVQTKMSNSIFLNPVAPSKRIVYFDMRNTSDKKMSIKNAIKQALIAKGYKITENPAKATYMLQGNILKVSKINKREAASYLNSGYGSALEGAATGAAAGYALTGSGRTSAAVGLAGAALGFIGNALVKDTVYVMITDLQIRERPLKGEVITQTQQTKLAQGTSTQVQQHIQGGKVHWITYRTRIVSTAEKVNLKFDEARPVLQKELVRSISGIF